MEFKGEEFVKNIQLKQEKEEIKQRLDEINTIEAQKVESIDDSVIVDMPEQELGDILLNDRSNDDNKKKYIVLGAVLLVLFVLTIVIIRLITDDSESNNSLIASKDEKIKQDEALDNNIEQQYQNIINQKLKEITKSESKPESEIKKSKDSLDIENVKKELKPIPQTDTKTESQKIIPKEDIFGLKKEEAKEVVKNEAVETVKSSWPEKKSVLQEPIVADSKKESSISVKPSGIFVQIGAFTKVPSDKYLKNIKDKGFGYRLYKVEIKGKEYIKVLIGPYKSRTEATSNINTIKQKLQAPNAYILKL